ncbi:extracellular solute-binding protein family 1 [Beutenbergia cavernae DSM 12333]|uniref:Extracellular solute-binding protein family 1 n=1 Tax=Beutenbergia cavernae (strain ATCC BAA-8 / DSM 12333 / CCUG 43141 / JCM 11478 / NBRC 16432 / NCIMB 13614 / HKI 0122) TaxID=471853 RepID=C5C4L7_BEUC1|nr:extracellular solute-binding protein [Beutenbergia cavernae]ACQ82141.1 extracellular solute-binding protein family 1 [Beutenbergia cavernae DSM 12333]
MKDLQRRTFLGAGAGLLATGALTACGSGSGAGGGGGGGGGGEDQGAARVAWYGGQPVHDGMAAALDAFASDNPDVDLETEFAAFDDYWDKLATQTAGGTTPDVFRMSMSYFAEYAERGALLDLADAVGNGDIDTGDLDDDVAVSGDVADGTFGVGQSSIAFAVFVDPAQLDAVGLPAPDADWTWDDYEALTTEFHAAAGDDSYGSNDNGGNIQAFSVYARQLGGELFTQDGSFGVEQDAVEEWFALWERLRQSGAVPPADVTTESAGFENSLLVKGRSPLQFGWVQQVTFYQPLTENPLEVVTVPSMTSGDLSGLYIKALDFWCVSGTTSSPDTAASVVDFLINDDRAIEAIGLTLGVPPSARARELLGAAPDSAEGRAIAYIESITDQVGAPPPAWPSGYSAVSDAFARANEGIAFGDLDAAGAAAQVMEAAAR